MAGSAALAAVALVLCSLGSAPPLVAAEPVVSLSTTMVSLTFGGSSEYITVTASGGQTVVTSSVSGPFPFDNPTVSLTIDAGGGHDTIEWISADVNFAAAVFLYGGDGDDVILIRSKQGPGGYTLDGQAGNDLIALQSTGNTLNGITGPFTILGGAHLGTPTRTESVTAAGQTISLTVPAGDALVIHDEGFGGGDTYTLGATTFNVGALAQIGFYSGIETIEIYAGAGPNLVVVSDTPAFSHTTVTGKILGEDIDVATTGNGGPSILVISAQDGPNLVDIASTGPSGVVIVNAGADTDALTLTGSGSGSGVALDGGGGADSIVILGAGAGGSVLGRGGAEPDQLTLASAGGNSRIELDGGAGDDTLTVGGAAAGNETWALGDAGSDALFYSGPAAAWLPSGPTDGSLQAPAPQIVSYSSIEGLSGSFLLDFGDAPDGGYRSLLTSNGARHAGVGGLRLGALWDLEADGQPAAAADGDGADEDGVSFTNGPELGIDSVGADLIVSASGNGRLDAWIDFNADGDWDDFKEQIYTNRSLGPGDNLLSFTTFTGALPGPTYVRFRLSTAGGLASSGLAADGEVEDYRVTIRPPDDLWLMSRMDSGPRTFWACNSIATEDFYVVAAGGDVTFHAAHRALLGDGTVVATDAVFTVVLGTVPGC